MDGQPLFQQQQSELRDSLEALHQSIVGKVSDVYEKGFSEEMLQKWRGELGKQVEKVHTLVGNYSGCCTLRKMQIERVISERLDVRDFSNIGNALLNGQW